MQLQLRNGNGNNYFCLKPGNCNFENEDNYNYFSLKFIKKMPKK